MEEYRCCVCNLPVTEADIRQGIGERKGGQVFCRLCLGEAETADSEEDARAAEPPSAPAGENSRDRTGWGAMAMVYGVFALVGVLVAVAVMESLKGARADVTPASSAVAEPAPAPASEKTADPGEKAEPDPETAPKQTNTKAVPEGLEMEAAWRSEPWTNAADVTHPVDETGNVLLELELKEGPKEKTALGCSVQWNLEGRRAVSMMVHNPDAQDVKLALALQTAKEYHESVPITIPQGGGQRNVRFQIDENTKTWKSSATKWHFKTALQGAEAVSRVYLVIYYGKHPGRLRFDRIRIE